MHARQQAGMVPGAAGTGAARKGRSARKR
jgi:hypothetical protein